MRTCSEVAGFIESETRALLTRLDSLQLLSYRIPAVRAASVDPAASEAIDRHIVVAKRELRALARRTVTTAGQRREHQREQQLVRNYSLLRLRFMATLNQLDIFADAVSQRAESDYGVWLAGLDAVARDALRIPGVPTPPPLVVYLDRGAGAAIRRARTRLPGGSLNPVTIIRVPRERMIGSAVGVSLIHEVGHQGAALLDLVPSLKRMLRETQERSSGLEQRALEIWGRWISEIIADLWSISALGVSASAGLMGLLTLPRFFVFRLSLGDPHPFPYIRVKVGIAFGRALYPDRRWSKLESIWERMFPSRDLKPALRRSIAELESSLPLLTSAVLSHKPASLEGRTLRAFFTQKDRQPRHLSALLEGNRARTLHLRDARPSRAIAALGLARLDQAISSREENQALRRLLRDWALAHSAA